jgi:type I restriction enzyme S subunit
MKSWPRAKLGDVAPIVRRAVEIDMNGIYPELGIRSFGKGTFHKPALAGADVGSKRLFKIEPGDLIFSNVFAWEGAVAVAGCRDAGRFGSHRFITCVVDSERVDASFLSRYLTASPEGLEQLKHASPGGAGRNRTLGVEKLAEIKVPIPPLDEQQAIVARLDTLEDKVRQVTEHLDAIDQAADALTLSLHHKLACGRVVKLSDVIELYEESVEVRPDGEYPQVGVRGFGGGLFAKAAVAGTETTYRAFNRLYPEAIVLSQVKGWEGALATCPSSLAGMFVSPEYRTFRCRPNMASPFYLGTLMGTPWFWNLLQGATRGVGARRERTRPEQFLNIELPMPEYSDQLVAVEILSRQTKLKHQHAAIREANAALVPAMLERIFSGAAQ